MGMFDKLKSFFKDEKTDISTRFDFSREAVSGTMSKFRQAYDIENERTVGLKILDMEKNATFEARFKGLKKPGEGEIAMKMSHPGIVQTYEHGLTRNNELFIVMEYVPGAGLSALIKAEDANLAGNRLPLAVQMAEALQAVHAAGYIHRDICPRNFIISPDAQKATLIDFGLALPDLPPYRLPGNRTGTPLYMAPEIVRRRATDCRVDIFAFGVTLYRLFASTYPWGNADTTGKTALNHDTQQPASILAPRPDLNPQLADLIMKCIEPNPDHRPQSMSKVVQRLKSAGQEQA